MLTTENNPVAILMMEAHTYLNTSQLDQAETVLNQIVTMMPDNNGAHALLAFVAFLRGDYALAESKTASIVDQDPLLCEAYLVRGFALAELHRKEEAIVVLQKVLALAPNCQEAQLLINQLRINE
jgi:predicted Zn-dependent protease